MEPRGREVANSGHGGGGADRDFETQIGIK